MTGKKGGEQSIASIGKTEFECSTEDTIPRKQANDGNYSVK